MADRHEMTLGELFSRLTDETRALFRQEVNLAKAEVGEKVSRVQEGVVSIIIGGVVAFAGLLALLAALIAGLSVFMEVWIAALAVGVLVSLIGLTLVTMGRAKLKTQHMDLPRTKQTLQEDKQWIKAQMR